MKLAKIRERLLEHEFACGDNVYQAIGLKMKYFYSLYDIFLLRNKENGEEIMVFIDCNEYIFLRRGGDWSLVTGKENKDGRTVTLYWATYSLLKPVEWTHPMERLHRLYMR